MYIPCPKLVKAALAQLNVHAGSQPTNPAKPIHCYPSAETVPICSKHDVRNAITAPQTLPFRPLQRSPKPPPNRRRLAAQHLGSHQRRQQCDMASVPARRCVARPNPRLALHRAHAIPSFHVACSDCGESWRHSQSQLSSFAAYVARDGAKPAR